MGFTESIGRQDAAPLEPPAPLTPSPKGGKPGKSSKAAGEPVEADNATAPAVDLPVVHV